MNKIDFEVGKPIKISGVYALISKKSKKMYIGSSINIRNRYLKHLKDFQRKSKPSIEMQNEYNLYGFENFELFLLEEVEDVKKLREEEYKWLNKYWDNNILYNIVKNTFGGCIKHTNITKVKIGNANSKHIVSEETKQKISEKLKEYSLKGYNWNKGKKRTEEQKIKMSEKLKGNNHTLGHNLTIEHKNKISISLQGEKNHFFGKKHTEQTRKKMSINHRDITGLNNPIHKRNIKGKNNPSSIQIIQKDLEGRVVKIWETIKDLSNNLNEIGRRKIKKIINEQIPYKNYIYVKGEKKCV